MFDGDNGAGGDGGEPRHGGGEQTAATHDTANDIDQIEGLGDKGKEAIRQERAAAKAAAADAAKAREERDALLKEKQERDAAAVKAREKAAAEAGKFEELAATREQERDAATADAARLTAAVDQYKAAVEKVLADEWKALPPEAIEAYTAAGGKDDDPLGKLVFLPAGKKLAAKLADKGDPKRGNGPDPRSRSEHGNDEAGRKAQATLYRNF